MKHIITERSPTDTIDILRLVIDETLNRNESLTIDIDSYGIHIQVKHNKDGNENG